MKTDFDLACATIAATNLFWYHVRMNTTSTSALRYFQRSGRGRHGGRDYRLLGFDDPFRNGQVTFQPRMGSKLNTIDRMISKPCAMSKKLRNMY